LAVARFSWEDDRPFSKDTSRIVVPDPQAKALNLAYRARQAPGINGISSLYSGSVAKLNHWDKLFLLITLII
jgi:hypothetical protein